MPTGRPGTAAGQPILVIGAGVIGVLLAYELQRRGREVMLVDRDEPGRGASFGNMASIAVTEFLPTSRPSIWAQLPRWLLDREGPIRISPFYLPKLAPWLLRFLAAGLPARAERIEAAGAALCQRVYDDLLPLLADVGLADCLSETGCLSLYKDDAELAADREHLDAIARFGFDHRIVEPDELRMLEPAIARDIRRAVLLPQNRSVKDPHALVAHIFEAFLARGGRFVAGDVVGFERDADGVNAARLGDGRSLAAAEMALCAGAYTGRLARMLGEPIPLETERGYHSQIMAPGIALRHSLIWPARAFMVTPTAGGIRVGGTVEMAGLDAAPDYRRARVLVDRAREALPGLAANEVGEWMGHRPALPDTIPILGPSAKVKGIWYATGHGHLGLTLAATTARLMGDRITGQTPPIDMTPFRVDRF